MIQPFWSLLTVSNAEEGSTVSSGGTGSDIQALGQDVNQEQAQENSLEKSLEQRLLGEIEEVPTASTDITSFADAGFPLWVYPLFLIVLLAFVVMKWKKGSTIAPGEIRVLSRTPLGKEGSLAVVAVASDDGTTKKLLLGLHGNAAPRLIDYLEPQLATTTSRELAVVSEEIEGGEKEPFENFLDRTAKETGKTETRTAEKVGKKQDSTLLEDRNDLVKEVLQARGIDQYRQAANEDQTFLSFDEDEDDDDPWATGLRNIYNQKSK